MKDDAVSPVIGVMIMVTITILIAGVLAAFAGGMTGNSAPSPHADISAEFIGSGEDISLILSHDGGGYLFPKEVKISAFVRTGDETADGKSMILSDVCTLASWGVGDIIRLTPEDTQNLLGMTGEKVQAAAKVSTPVTLRLYHTPSSEIISQVSLLLEES